MLIARKTLIIITFSKLFQTVNFAQIVTFEKNVFFSPLTCVDTALFFLKR